MGTYRCLSPILLSLLLLSCQENEFVGGESVQQIPSVPPVVVPPVILPPEPPPPCEDKEEIEGAHFIFLVDNSGSMLETDCPNRDEEGRCDETNREKAMLATFDTLSELFESSDSLGSLSFLSLARFTPVDQGSLIESPEQTDFISIPAKADRRDELKDGLRYNRTPKGDTLS